MLPYSQADISRSFFSGFFQGLLLFVQAGWPYLLALIALVALSRFLKKRPPRRKK